MAVPLTGLGGLFTRLGKIGRIGQATDVAEAALLAPFNNLLNQYDSTLQAVIAPVAMQEDGSVRAQSGVMGFATGLAQSTLLGMVSADVPVIRTVTDSLNELRRQMIASGATVARCNLSVNAVVIPPTTGSGVAVFTTRRGDGLSQENMIGEQARLLCSADSYTGKATAGRESFVFVGDPQNAGTWDYDWPQGSAASVGIQAISSSQYGSSTGNALVNGDFEQWTSGVASAWVIGPGVYGTDALQSTTPYHGTYALQLAPTGTLTALLQPFANATLGSGVSLNPLLSYAVNFWCRALGTVTAGTLVAELVDGNGVVVNDQQGVPNSFSVDLTTLPATYKPFSGSFRAPSPPPATLQLRLRLGTALAGGSVLLDSLAMAPFAATYAGGPGVAVFSGAVPFLLSDGWTVWTSNDRAGQPYLGTFQALFDRLFGSRSLNYLLPSALSPTIPDTLISQGGSSGTPIGLLLGLTYP